MRPLLRLSARSGSRYGRHGSGESAPAAAAAVTPSALNRALAGGAGRSSRPAARPDSNAQQQPRRPFFMASAAEAGTALKVPLDLVKQLRKETLAGYSDCQKALRVSHESGEFSLARAKLWLREKGLASAAKRSNKVAAEGSVGVLGGVSGGKKGILCEVNAETDFVARGGRFLSLVEGCCVASARAGGVADAGEVLGARVRLSTELVESDDVSSSKAETNLPGEELSLADHVTGVAAAVGEKLALRRVAVVAVPDGAHGVVATASHGVKHRFESGVVVGGRAAALALVVDEVHASQFSEEALAGLGAELAKQVLGFGADYVSAEDVPQDVLDAHRVAHEKRREELMQARSAAEEAESKIEWNPRKAYADLVLLDQEFMGQKKKVRDHILAWCKKQGWKQPPVEGRPTGPPALPVRVATFARFVCGEGIEKAEDDFANEVSQMVADSKKN